MVSFRPESWQTALSQLPRLCDRLVEAVPWLHLTGVRVRLRALRSYIEYPGGGGGRHSHSFSEAVFFLEGNARMIPDDTPLTSGTVLAHTPLSVHAWEPLTRIVRLVMSYDVLPPMLLLSPLIRYEATTIIGDLLRALGEMDTRQSGWEDRAHCLLTLVISSLLASGIPDHSSSTIMEVEPSNLAAEVDQYLLDNLRLPIRLADLAGHIGMSERSLTLHYRRLTGVSIMTRLRHLRLQEAQSLLLHTQYSLAEIGRQVGIPDPPYLCRCYKQQFGESPGRQRRV